MVSSKESIARLIEICKAKGILNVVFSPGSRNAPLIISFGDDPHFNTFNIPDERTAGFFALGLSLHSRQATILCCTSGSALLNYGPALSEAYYQKIPLIVISADRPIEWIDQRAGQTLRQNRVFANYIRGSFELLQEATNENHLWYNDRIVNQAIDVAMVQDVGPVHINIPLHEPLYDQKASADHKPKIINSLKAVQSLSVIDANRLKEKYSNSKSVLVLCGQHHECQDWKEAIERLSNQKNVVVLSEATSNLSGDQIVCCIDRTIDRMDSKDKGLMAPSLLITCGKSIVSKKIRFLLRELDIEEHWHVDQDDTFIDTYQSLTLNVPTDILEFIRLLELSEDVEPASEFKKSWLNKYERRKEKHNEYLKEVSWSDLYVVNGLMNQLSVDHELHMANSTSVRYVQLFDIINGVSYHCNRGVSGIDGCTSTGIGYSYFSDKENILLTGDVAFFYDSNAFWHHHIPSNFKVIILNNAGGNIFRVIPGPDSTAHLETHFEAHHTITAADTAKQYGLEYLSATNESEFKNTLTQFMDYKEGAMILEVFTPRFENDKILKNYFEFISL